MTRITNLYLKILKSGDSTVDVPVNPYQIKIKSVVDTGGKFAAGVNDAGGALCVANFQRFFAFFLAYFVPQLKFIDSFTNLLSRS
jgi:hypothetical protein